MSESTLLRIDGGSDHKNHDGHLGPICNNCGGFGYTLRLLGEGSGGCQYCGQTGVARKNSAEIEADFAVLAERLHRTEGDLAEIKQLLRESVQSGGLSRKSAWKTLVALFRAKPAHASRQFWVETLVWATGDGVSVNTTAAETIIFPNVTIPANYMQDGRALNLGAKGEWSTTTGTVTVIYRLRWGGVAGTLMATTGTITQVVSITRGVWELDLQIQTRSNGATGTMLTAGKVFVFASTAPTVGNATGSPAVSPMTVGGQNQSATPTSTQDQTADTALSLTVQMGASSASNIILGHQYTLESLN